MTVTLRELIETADYTAFPDRLDISHLTTEVISLAIHGEMLGIYDQRDAFIAGEDLELVVLERLPDYDLPVGLFLLLLSGRAVAVFRRSARDYTDGIISFLSTDCRAAFLKAWDRYRPAEDAENVLDADSLATPIGMGLVEERFPIELSGSPGELRLTEAGARARFAEILHSDGLEAFTDMDQLRNIRRSIALALKGNEDTCANIEALEEDLGPKLDPGKRQAMQKEAQEALRGRRALAEETLRTIVEPINARLEKEAL